MVTDGRRGSGFRTVDSLPGAPPSRGQCPSDHSGHILQLSGNHSSWWDNLDPAASAGWGGRGKEGGESPANPQAANHRSLQNEVPVPLRHHLRGKLVHSQGFRDALAETEAQGGDRSGSHQALQAHSMGCHPHSSGPSIPSCGTKTRASLLVQRELAALSITVRTNSMGDQEPLQAQAGAIKAGVMTRWGTTTQQPRTRPHIN